MSAWVDHTDLGGGRHTVYVLDEFLVTGEAVDVVADLDDLIEQLRAVRAELEG
jgi:hypothetical protein